MIICDLCGEAKDCLQKEIPGKEYDICPEGWNPLAQKLRERQSEESGNRLPTSAKNKQRTGR